MLNVKQIGGIRVEARGGGWEWRRTPVVRYDYMYDDNCVDKYMCALVLHICHCTLCGHSSHFPLPVAT